MPTGTSISHGIRARRRRALCRGALALPAVLTLAASPLRAAAPDVLLIPMCTAEGPQLVPVGGDPASPPGDGSGQSQMGCAHALCPRGILPVVKARSRV